MSNNLHSVIKVIGSNGNQLFGYGNQGPLAHTSALGGLFDKTWMYALRRNGNVTPETMRHDAGPSPAFHHVLDPATPASLFSLVWENTISGLFSLGLCRIFAGYVHYVTAGDKTTMMGIGFYADSSDGLWHSFAIDSVTGGAPYVSKHDTASAITVTDIHRLKFIISGPDKNVKFYIDNTLFSTFTPAAALERMAPAANIIGPQILMGAFVPASGDVTVRGYAGSIPLIRLLVNSTPVLPVAGAGTTMHVSVIG